jgi:hypothetical protein
MAKADSVPSSSRQLITGESANQSTNLRAADLPAARQEQNRGYLIGGSHVSATISGEEARPLRLWQEKRGDQPQDLLKCRYWANAAQAPAGSSPETLFYLNAALFLGRLLNWIVLILLLPVSRNKRLRLSALDKVSPTRLVRPKPQGRLK